RMGESKLWVRLLTSTGVGEFVDTLLFCIIAFAGVIPGLDFLNYIIVGFVYTVAVEVILMPVTYRVITLDKRHEPSYELGGVSRPRRFAQYRPRTSASSWWKRPSISAWRIWATRPTTRCSWCIVHRVEKRISLAFSRCRR